MSSIFTGSGPLDDNHGEHNTGRGKSMISQEQMDELTDLCEAAKQSAEAFRKAVTTVAEQHQMEPVALGRYVRAVNGDKLDKLHREQATLAQLGLDF